MFWRSSKDDLGTTLLLLVCLLLLPSTARAAEVGDEQLPGVSLLAVHQVLGCQFILKTAHLEQESASQSVIQNQRHSESTERKRRSGRVRTSARMAQCFSFMFSMTFCRRRRSCFRARISDLSSSLRPIILLSHSSDTITSLARSGCSSRTWSRRYAEDKPFWSCTQSYTGTMQVNTACDKSTSDLFLGS